MKKDKKHFDSADIFFLKIPEELSKDSLRLIDKIVSYGFKKFSPNNSRTDFMYCYDKPITTHFWQKKSDAPYRLKGIIFKTRYEKYIPVVFVKDLSTGKEYKPQEIPTHDKKVIDRVVDEFISDLMELGVVTIADNKVIKLKEREKNE